MDQPPEVSRLLPGRRGSVVRLVCRAGSRPALLDALHTYADRLDEEPGTEAFVISLDPDNPEAVWLFEWFRNPDAWEKHRSAPAFADLLRTLSEVLAEPPGLLRLDPLRMSLAPSLLTTSADGTF